MMDRFGFVFIDTQLLGEQYHGPVCLKFEKVIGWEGAKLQSKMGLSGSVSDIAVNLLCDSRKYFNAAAP